MKKVVRLTESGLTNFIKQIIKENEFDMDMNFECDNIMDEMGSVFNEYMSNALRGDTDMGVLFDYLAKDLSDLVDAAYDIECENINDIEAYYDELLTQFESETENSDCDEFIDEMKYVYKDIKRHTKSSPENAKNMYNDLIDELGAITHKAYNMNCENVDEEYDKLLDRFADEFGIRRY